jgi:hypothetical protein
MRPAAVGSTVFVTMDAPGKQNPIERGRGAATDPLALKRRVSLPGGLLSTIAANGAQIEDAPSANSIFEAQKC